MSHDNDNLTDALRDLGDDEGRPLPKTPVERLNQFKTHKRRRRMAQLSIAATTVLALGIGGAVIAESRPVGTEPAHRPTTEPTRDPSATPDLDSALLIVEALPRQKGLDWVVDQPMTREALASEGECDAPLALRKGYRFRAFHTVGTATSGWVWHTVGQEPDRPRAEAAFDEAAKVISSCMEGTHASGRPRADFGIKIYDRADGADARAWIATAKQCSSTGAEQQCTRTQVTVGLARVGNLVLTTMTGAEATQGGAILTEADAETVLSAAISRAVAHSEVDAQATPVTTTSVEATAPPESRRRAAESALLRPTEVPRVPGFTWRKDANPVTEEEQPSCAAPLAGEDVYVVGRLTTDKPDHGPGRVLQEVAVTPDVKTAEQLFQQARLRMQPCLTGSQFGGTVTYLPVELDLPGADAAGVWVSSRPCIESNGPVPGCTARQFHIALVQVGSVVMVTYVSSGGSQPGELTVTETKAAEILRAAVARARNLSGRD